MIEITMQSIYYLLAAIGLLVGGIWGIGRILINQIIQRLDERFKAMEKRHCESTLHWDEKFSTLERTANLNEQEWRRVERDVLTLKADMPLHYVRREDYVRNQTVIEAKIDGVAVRLENVLLKGGRNG